MCLWLLIMAHEGISTARFFMFSIVRPSCWFPLREHIASLLFFRINDRQNFIFHKKTKNPEQESVKKSAEKREILIALLILYNIQRNDPEPSKEEDNEENLKSPRSYKNINENVKKKENLLINKQFRSFSENFFFLFPIDNYDWPFER